MESEQKLGPCLPWCFTHYRTTYIMIGILIGLFLYHLYLKSKKSNIRNPPIHPKYTY